MTWGAYHTYLSIFDLEYVEASLDRAIGKKLLREEGLRLVATGGALHSSKETIKEVYLDFMLKEKRSEEEARILLLKVLKDVLSSYSTSERIQKFLIEPFSLKNLKLTIFFDDSASSLENPELAWITWKGRVVNMCWYDNKSSKNLIKEINETLSEACAKAGVDEEELINPVEI